MGSDEMEYIIGCLIGIFSVFFLGLIIYWIFLKGDDDKCI